MVVYSAPWERRVLEMAYAGFEHIPQSCPRPETSAGALREAYAHAVDMTRDHSRTFYLASALLPPAKRSAMRALYAFCRVSDDIVDRSAGDAAADLAAWRRRIHEDCSTEDPVVLAWTDTQAGYGVPHLYARQLLEGVGRDLHQKRYDTFAALAAYSYGVASTVGLMAMHIVGFRGPEAVPYAVKLGIALQLTNILRDVREDWQGGRLYLPQEELAAFDLSEEDVAAGRVDDRWRSFMRFQIDRVRRLYAESLPGVALLHPDGRFAIAAAAELYGAILNDIEAHNMDVFHRRACVSGWGKLRRLPGIWWRATLGRYARGGLVEDAA